MITTIYITARAANAVIVFIGHSSIPIFLSASTVMLIVYVPSAIGTVSPYVDAE